MKCNSRFLLGGDDKCQTTVIISSIYRLVLQIMQETYYVIFPAPFVGFRHDYTRTEQRDASTLAGSQARASKKHLGKTQFAIFFRFKYVFGPYKIETF